MNGDIYWQKAVLYLSQPAALHHNTGDAAAPPYDTIIIFLKAQIVWILFCGPLSLVNKAEWNLIHSAATRAVPG